MLGRAIAAARRPRSTPPRALEAVQWAGPNSKQAGLSFKHGMTTLIVAFSLAAVVGRARGADPARRPGWLLIGVACVVTNRTMLTLAIGDAGNYGDDRIGWG